jgi:hypothetical protein
VSPYIVSTESWRLGLLLPCFSVIRISEVLRSSIPFLSLSLNFRRPRSKFALFDWKLTIALPDTDDGWHILHKFRENQHCSPSAVLLLVCLIQNLGLLDHDRNGGIIGRSSCGHDGWSSSRVYEMNFR